MRKHIYHLIVVLAASAPGDPCLVHAANSSPNTPGRSALGIDIDHHQDNAGNAPMRGERREAVTSHWNSFLQKKAKDGSLETAANEALGLKSSYGELRNLISRWSSGDFSALPPIKLLSANNINGANGAYVASSGTIYLNADWQARATDKEVFAVLAEELGHHLDQLLNSADSPGDEGELFALLISDGKVNASLLEDIMAENDSGPVRASGDILIAEYSTASSAGANFTQVIADSVNDFSSSQGSGGWRYGYYDGSLTPSTFKELSWNPSGWWDISSVYYTTVDQVGGHPHGPISNKPTQIEHWAVRRWVSQFTGDISISGNLNDINRGGGGDGVTGRIFLDGVEVYSSLVDHFSPSGGLPYSVSLSVSTGQFIDFAIDPNGWDGDDSTEFTATIKASTLASPAESVPGPLPIMALGSTFWWNRRLRKRMDNGKRS